jgi:hypothetical protein
MVPLRTKNAAILSDRETTKRVLVVSAFSQVKLIPVGAAVDGINGELA